MKRLILLLMLTVVLIISGCNQEVINEVEDISNQIEDTNIVENEEIINEGGEITDEIEVVEEEVIEEIIDERIDEEAYRLHQVNELGQIMVIMYHNLSEKPGAYATTKELFIEDLTRLYEMGFVTISMSDLINDHIDVPLGKTPVVLTFDDGTKSNFFYDEMGVSKESVVGILDEFSETHEGFGKNAIFYLYGTNPFREPDRLEEKLKYLIDEGYEIGTHTYSHEKFTDLDAVGIQKSIAMNYKFIKDQIDYDMVHLSIPYGVRPAESLRKYMFDGEYNGIAYHNVSAVNVGWNPIYSPSHIKFNPLSINRITCGDENAELHYWLDYFEANPEKRYYSDGNPNRIVIPEEYKESLREMLEKEVIIYGEE